MKLNHEELYFEKCANVVVPEIIDLNYIKKRNNEARGMYTNQYSWEFCGQDLSNSKIELTPEEFKMLSFDTNTIFSKEQEEKIHPQELLENGKHFLPELDDLHRRGITGRGMKVGVIDKPFNIDSDEFRDKAGLRNRVVLYKDFILEGYQLNQEDFHGKAVTSVLAGSSTGIVPDADIYLFNVKEFDLEKKQECRKNILRYIIEQDIRLDVLSMSSSFDYQDDELHSLMEQIKKMGIVFIDSTTFWKDFSYGRRTEDGVELDEMMKYMYENRSNLSSKRQRIVEDMPNRIIIPCAGRTHAQIGGGYMYDGVGCASWSIPQVAGLFCIAKQINKNITYDEFVECVRKTADRGECGLNMQLLYAMDAVGRCRRRGSKDMSLDRV